MTVGSKRSPTAGFRNSTWSFAISVSPPTSSKLRSRSANFGTPEQWLTKTKTDVVFAFFGYNESFAGAAGLPTFKKDVENFIKKTRSAQLQRPRLPAARDVFPHRTRKPA